MFTKVFENLRAKLRPSVEDDENFYGGNGTWHQSGAVDVQLNKDGEVVAVWFRCRMLPFTESREYTKDAKPRQGTGSIKGIVFEDDETEPDRHTLRSWGQYKHALTLPETPSN